MAWGPKLLPVSLVRVRNGKKEKKNELCYYQTQENSGKKNVKQLFGG